MEVLKPWTIKQIDEAYRRDLDDPTLTTLERGMVEVYARRDVKELASKLTRKLTPCEVAILGKWGIDH